MFGVISNWLSLESLRLFFSVLTTAYVVKMLDDYLDQEYDAEVGHYTIAQRLGKATLPYALLIFAVGCLLMPKVTVSYFLAAYAVGMIGESTRRFPSRLKGYQETAAVFLLGVLGVGWRQFGLSCLVILAVQAVDDLADYRRQERASRNWVVRWGTHFVQTFAVIASLLAFWLSPLQTTAALISALIVNRTVDGFAEDKHSTAVN